MDERRKPWPLPFPNYTMMKAAGDGAVRGRGRISFRVHPSSSSSSTNAAASSSSSSSSARPIFRVVCKGMVADEVGDGDSGMPVLAVVVCGPQGELLLTSHKPVPGFVGGYGALLETMALVEGLHRALGLGLATASVKVITGHRILYNYMLGHSRPNGEKLADMIDQALSARKQFEQCEVSLVGQGKVRKVVNLAKNGLDAEIARCLGINMDSCTICFEDVDIAKMHAVEGCAHRFCFTCMKKHIEAMLLRGRAPGCPQAGCTTKLTMEGSKAFLSSSRLVELMALRLREAEIHPSERIYCPYPKCSALMSLSQVQVQGSCSGDDAATTLSKCVQCGGSMCISCRVAWHEGMSCQEYQRRYPHGGSGGKRLHKLVKRRLWQQCERCNHLIEHAMGCERITCVCGYQFCYMCGKEWVKGSCPCDQFQRRRGGCFLPACFSWGWMRR